MCSGGLSAVASHWASFTASVNQMRAHNGLQAIGFANPVIYSMGHTGSNDGNFHDVTIGNNLYYTALQVG